MFNDFSSKIVIVNDNIFFRLEGFPFTEWEYRIPLSFIATIINIRNRTIIRKKKKKNAFYRSWNEGLEYVSLESGKGVAVDYLKKHLNGQIHTTVGVGDYENDITLLEYADIGYAVDNAIDCVKEVADRITVKNTEHAIAAVIKDLEETVI